MRYFRLETLGNRGDKSLAFLDRPPEDLGLNDTNAAYGEPVTEHWPAEAKAYLQPKSPGIKLPSLLGNSRNYLVVNTAMKDVILGIHKGETEVFPITIYNHKKRVHSKDYWVINPIGTIDCLNKKASEIEYGDDESEVVGVDKFVLDPKKLEDEPALFRVPEEPNRYFLSARLVKSLQEHKFTNVILEEVEVKASK